MIKHLMQIVSIGLVLAVLVGPLAAAIEFNPTNLFNAGVNLGWLRNTLEFGMNPWLHDTYASDFSAEFNAAISRSPWMQPPQTNVTSVGNYIEGIKGWLKADSLAYAVFSTGVSLAISQIDAQYGKCPSCLKASLGRAAGELRALGKILGNQNLEGMAVDLLERANKMQPEKMRVADVQSYSATLSNAMAAVRASLRSL